MRTIISALGAFLAFVSAQAVQAATLFDSSSIGNPVSVDFTGQVNGAAATQLSALLTLNLASISADGRSYTFNYSLTNDSSVASRIRSFGFDVDGGFLTGASATGAYPNRRLGDHFPEAIGNRDVCFHAAGNGQSDCTGGPNGLTQGQTGNGSFTLNFSSMRPAPGSIYLDLFVVRFQSISPGLNGGGTSGVGIGNVVPPPVPEPATWLMMILGFFSFGIILRQRAASPDALTA